MTPGRLDPDTVRRLSSDREFMTALEFPYGGTDA